VADITRSTGNIRATHPQNSIIFDVLVGETVTEGQLLYLASTGKYGVADTNVAGKQQVRGVALSNGGTGKPGVSMLVKGPVAGYTTNMPAYDAVVYASDTPGEIGTTAGTMSVAVGRVGTIPDGGTPTKVVYFDISWLTTWA
jgi:hypothetical protein